MRKYLLHLVIIFNILIIWEPPTARGFEKTGTAAATFLKIGVGARAMALGGSFVARADDASALYWNPAGIGHILRPSLMGAHSAWIGDLSHDFVGFVAPFHNGRIGVSGLFLNTEEIEITTIYDQDGTGLFYDASDMALSLAYSQFLTDRFNVGVSVKYIHQSVYDMTAQTVAFDIGTQLKTNFGGAVVGMAVTNFGGKMILSGSRLIVASDADPNYEGDHPVDARLKTESWALPLTFRVGVALAVIGDDTLFFINPDHTVSLSLDGLHPNDGPERGSIGIEYSWQDMFMLRSGYRFGYDQRDLSWGGGVKIGMKSYAVVVDYAYSALELLDDIQTISIGVEF